MESRTSELEKLLDAVNIILSDEHSGPEAYTLWDKYKVEYKNLTGRDYVKVQQTYLLPLRKEK